MTIELADGRTLPGIHRLELPLPFYPKNVYCYLIDADRKTLIDCGLSTPESLEELRRQMEPTGIAVEEIDLLLLTHAHLDHCGQAGQVKALSGCDVGAHRLGARNIEDFPQADESNKPRVREILRTWGVSDDLIKNREEQAKFWEGVRDDIKVDLLLEDGEVLDLGGMKLTVLHVPGHSEGQMVLHDAEGRILFSADHLLPDISPVPLIQLYHAGAEMPKSLISFLASVRKVDGLGLEVALPAHGEPILDVDSLIESYRLHTEKRQLKVERIMRKRGPLTAFETAVLLFDDKRAKEQMFLCLSEVVGHLQLLDRRGRLNIDRRDGLFYYGYKEEH